MRIATAYSCKSDVLWYSGMSTVLSNKGLNMFLREMFSHPVKNLVNAMVEDCGFESAYALLTTIDIAPDLVDFWSKGLIPQSGYFERLLTFAFCLKDDCAKTRIWLNEVLRSDLQIVRYVDLETVIDRAWRINKNYAKRKAIRPMVFVDEFARMYEQQIRCR